MTVFYRNYLKYCAIKGESPSGAAIAIGMSNAAANGWKNGKIPSQITQVKLADHFGITIEDLMEENENPSPKNEDGPAYNPKYLLLSPSKKAIVDSLIAELLDGQSQQ